MMPLLSPEDERVARIARRILSRLEDDAESPRQAMAILYAVAETLWRKHADRAIDATFGDHLRRVARHCDALDKSKS